MAFFLAHGDRFLGDNLSIVLQQVMVVGVIAIGQTLVILTAGVDLSCGMVMALGGIVMTKLASRRRSGPLAIAEWDRRRDAFACSTAARHAASAAAVHRHARHAQHRVRDHAVYSNSQTVTDLPTS